MSALPDGSAQVNQSDALAQLLRELVTLVMQRSSGEMLQLMGEVGISMPQMVALHQLQRCGAHSISAIAARLNLSLGATSQLVDRMVKDGLVVRTEDQHDRRLKHVAITPAGEAILERLVAARYTEIGRLASMISPDLQAQLAHALAQVLAELRIPLT